jgi:hypothetical protein
MQFEWLFDYPWLKQWKVGRVQLQGERQGSSFLVARKQGGNFTSGSACRENEKSCASSVALAGYDACRGSLCPSPPFGG